ncbi:MAG: gliding motility-associated C-terminal domain-containing protein [Flavobacteriales bacterium]|nr:gliding motility-associated C-terminal domain-containing protein [Flavobacteriales bacterium]
MRRLASLLLFIISCLSIHAQQQYALIENKGQWPAHVTSQVELKGGWMFLENNAFTYHFMDLAGIAEVHSTGTNIEDLAGQTKLKGHVYKTRFEGANSEPIVQFEEELITRFNYFLGNDPNKWQGNVPSYSAARYSDLYPGVDLHVYSKEFAMKYDLLLEAGVNPDIIQIRYDGVESITLRNGRLVIRTSVNETIEQAPIAWQFIDGEKVYLNCEYDLLGDLVSFAFPKGYNNDYPIIIDPELLFSTYSGSTADNFGYTATFDDEGYLYSGSSAFGSGYPVTVGAYQQTWAGGDGQGFLQGTDIAITKYDVTGTFRVYSTYLGGPNDELPHSLIVNAAGELIVMGTSSSPMYPTTEGSYSADFNGGSTVAPVGVGVEYVNGSDIIVSKFTADGSALAASTFLGGSGNDGVNTAPNLKFNYADEFRGEVELDNDGNVIIVSCTYSADYPSVSAFQGANAGGLDGCITKLDDDLSNVLFSSYYGGSGNDGVYAAAVDSQNDIFICGGTTSTNFPTEGTPYQNAFGGGTADGFISKIQQSSVSIEASTFFGSNAYDQAYFIEVDSNDQPYIYGQSMAANSTWIINAAYGTPNSGMLVSKLDDELSAIGWSTVFGTGSGEPNLSPTAFLVDVCGKIYLSGWGGTTNTSSNPNTDTVFGMETTPDAYQDDTNGSDFYLLVLEDDASDIVYGSFFGGLTSAEHVDGGTSRFNRKGQIYQSVCAGCGSNDDFPIFPVDAVSPLNQSTNCNNGVFKFDFELPITVADFYAPPVGCVNIPVQFQNNSSGGLNFEWDFGDNTTSTLPNPIHTYDEPGVYTVSLVANHPSTCNMSDTLFRQIEILEPQTTSLNDLEICEGESIGLGPVPFDPSYDYEWNPAETLDDASIPEPTATPSDDTDYTLLIDNGACIDTVFQTVALNLLDLQAPEDIVLCEENIDITLTANSDEPGVEWIWSSSPDFLDQLNDNINDNDIVVNVDEETTFYVQVSIGDCVRTDEVTISFLTTALDIGGDFVVCAGDTVTLTVLNELPGFEITWEPAGQVLTGQGTNEVQMLITEDTLVSVTATDGDDCTVTEDILVEVSGLDLNDIGATANPTQLSGGESTNLSVVPLGFDYTWSPAETIFNPNVSSTSATPTETTTYYVTVADGECLYTDSVRVFVFDFDCGPPSIYVPNAFTPNSDQLNEQLYVRGVFITDLYFVIYDRWGEVMFETTSLSLGWDATFKGRDVDPDVYVYYLEAVCEDGQTYFEKGNITVIR